LFLFITFLYAFKTLTPYKKITFNDYISKITYNKKFLIVGLESGKILIQKNNKTIYTIKLPKIHDFMGDLIAMPIYSLDILNNTLLILTEGENATRNLYLFNLQTKKLKKIFTTKETLMKARFINQNQIFFALLSDEVMLYDLNSKKEIYKNQVGQYVFSTFRLNKNKTLCAVGDESGSIKIVDVRTGKKLKEIKGYNKDKTISLDIQKNLVINGSSDLRVGIYNFNQNSLILGFKVKFLPYASAISPNEKTFALQFDEKNNIMVYSIYNEKLYKLKGHTMALIDMKYLNNNEIISFSPAEILYWRLK
jgi:WD40 repeat protein